MLHLPEIARAPSLAEKAKQLIQEAIWTGSLAPGAHLVETHLAEQFRISRGPLREALRSLAAAGLIDFRPGRGAFVVDPSPEEMQDMIILRAMLGGLAARYVTAKGDPEVLDQLEAACGRMKQAAKANAEPALFDHHWAYFDILHRGANEFVHRSWLSLYGLINIYMRRLGPSYVTTAQIVHQYESVMKVFRSGDADEAEAVMRTEILRFGFKVLDRPIPPMLAPYMTRQIAQDGTIIDYVAEPVGKKKKKAAPKLAKNKTSKRGNREGPSPSPNKGRARGTGRSQTSDDR